LASYDFDLFVIGAGSGGVRAARVAAMAGARVAVAEEHRVGGTCVIRGCVPKKFMVYASEFSKHFQTARGYGWTIGETRFDWTRFLMEKDKEIARLSGIYVRNLQNAGAQLVHGKARLKDRHTIEVEGHGTVTAEKVLVATGGRPWMPAELPGIEHAITSNEAFHLESLPRSILIAGGGYISLEFAGIFNGLGVDTTVMYRGPNVLRGFDDDIRAFIAEEMEERGIKIVLGTQHTRLEKTATGVANHDTNGHALETDVAMFAVGRVPYTDGLGLEEAGVNLSEIREGEAFARTEFLKAPTAFDHETVASAVFTQPQIGTVGLSEADARHKYGKVDVYLAKFRPMKETFYGGHQRALVKLVVECGSERILGCHVAAPEAAEIIQMAAVAIKMGVTKPQWDSTCAVHPTLAEELVTLREKYTPPALGQVA
jgi:glutathione reductase (NADPH)